MQIFPNTEASVNFMVLLVFFSKLCACAADLLLLFQAKCIYHLTPKDN